MVPSQLCFHCAMMGTPKTHLSLIGTLIKMAAEVDRILLKITQPRSSPRGTAETNPTRNHEVVGSIPGLTQWVKNPVLL